METSFVNQLLELSPPVALWFALNFLLMFAKKCPCVPNWMIPWLSFIAGGIVYPMISDPNSVSFAVRYPVAAQSLTGLLIGGAAVGSHQLFKQTIKRFGFSTGDTEQFIKEDACQNP